MTNLKKEIIPDIHELVSLSVGRKDEFIKDIVREINKAAVAGKRTAVKIFSHNKSPNKAMAEEIKQDFINKGYQVVLFVDNSWRSEGTSFSIMW